MANGSSGTHIQLFYDSLYYSAANVRYVYVEHAQGKWCSDCKHMHRRHSAGTALGHRTLGPYASLHSSHSLCLCVEQHRFLDIARVHCFPYFAMRLPYMLGLPYPH